MATFILQLCQNLAVNKIEPTQNLAEAKLWAQILELCDTIHVIYSYYSFFLFQILEYANMSISRDWARYFLCSLGCQLFTGIFEMFQYPEDQKLLSWSPDLCHSIFESCNFIFSWGELTTQ